MRSNARRALITLALASGSAPALGVTIGFLQDFAGTSVGGFGGGSALTNPGTDGVGGAVDGFLRVTNATTGNFGTFAQTPEFTGDYTAAGVGGVTFFIRDVGTTQSFEMHLALGPSPANFWQYNAQIIPTGQWTKVYINLANINPAQWTRIRGTGTLDAALHNVTHLLLRNDNAPFGPTPNTIMGDLGIDRYQLHPICPGDTDGDDAVGFPDLNNILTNFGHAGINLAGDTDNNGTVEFADLNTTLTNFGHTCP